MYAEDLFAQFVAFAFFPILVSYLCLPLSKFVRSKAIKAALWWPFIEYEDENGIYRIRGER